VGGSERKSRHADARSGRESVCVCVRVRGSARLISSLSMPQKTDCCIAHTPSKCLRGNFTANCPCGQAMRPRGVLLSPFTRVGFPNLSFIPGRPQGADYLHASQILLTPRSTEHQSTPLWEYRIDDNCRAVCYLDGDTYVRLGLHRLP